MNEKTYQEYLKWLNEPSLSEEERKSLSLFKDNEEQINDAFFQNLKFGTAGLRGVLGLGTNRLNQYTVRKATQGLANHLNKIKKNAKVAIGYDSRHFSREYAFEAAKVLSSNGIEAYVYNELQPTPVLSFTVRELKCDAGIILTASHNPKQYNGYKLYGPNGCQATEELASAVSEEINKLDIFKDVKANDDSKVYLVDEAVYESFLASTLKKSLLNNNENRDIKLIYSPLNGTGRYPVQEILSRCGFKKVVLVKEQEKPDPDFTTCPYPNPEMKEALKLGVELLEKENADVFIATDPDCDRVGFVNKDSTGIHYFTGNEVGVILFDFVYHTLKERNLLPKNPVIVKTIVSTDLIDVMAKSWNVTVNDVLTGFKYIGELIGNLEGKNRKEDFLLGFEESCGYLTNTDVRDKDAVNASMLIAELTAFWKNRGKSVYERLQEIYEEFGHYYSQTISYEFPGESGLKKMADFMEYFRNNDVTFPNVEVVTKNDYLASISKTKNEETIINLPKSNVIKYIFNDSSTLTIRPSGTEPKIKFYFCSKNLELIEQIKLQINELVK